jgi:ketosteroid isomerase-like protein
MTESRHRRRIRPWSVLGFVLAACVAGAEPAQEDEAAAHDDVAAVRALEEAYVAAWVANDRAAVMATLADSAAIIPTGMQPITERHAIEEFWWPAAGPATTVTAYTTAIDDIGVGGDLAWVRGRGDLAFTLAAPDGSRTEHRSRNVFLMVARRDAAGAWRIAQRMWSSAPLP